MTTTRTTWQIGVLALASMSPATRGVAQDTLGAEFALLELDAGV